jgi:hypothetical protein
MKINQTALAFFNKLSGKLQIGLSQEPAPVSEKLLNLVADPAAQVVDVKLKLEVYKDKTFRPLSDEEWSLVVFEAPAVELRGDNDEIVEHRAPNGRTFTVRDLAACVEETERRTRGSTEWLGGVDVHHVFFEGLSRESDGSWAICWGS